MKDSKRLLVVLISLVVIVSVLLVVGILVLASMPGSTPEPDPEPTAIRLTPPPTFSLTPTFSPTPKPTPSPTSELEYQTEKEKLGIYEADRIIPANYVDAILYKNSSGEYKIAFTLTGFNNPNNFIIDLFTAEYLFSFDNTTYKKVFEEGYTKSVVPINSSLMDATFLRYSTTLGLISDFSILNSGFEDWAYALYLHFEENSYKFYTKSELADIYLQYIPKEYRVYGSDFAPGTKAKFPDITPSPDPSGSPNPTQSVSP